MNRLLVLLILSISTSSMAATYQSPVGDTERNINIGAVNYNEGAVSIYLNSPSATDPFEMEGMAFFPVQHYGELRQDSCLVKIRLLPDASGEFTKAEVTHEGFCEIPMNLNLDGTYLLKK